MKKKVIPVLFSLFLIAALMATPVFAKDSQNSGKPFEELWDAIEQLRNDISSIVQLAVEDAMLSLSISWSQITDIPAGLDDGDNDTQLTEAQVDAFVDNNGYLTDYSETDPLFADSAASGIMSEDITNWNTIDWNEISNMPAGFADGTDDEGSGAGDGHSLDAADGDPVDAVYVDKEGKVGIGTSSPSGVLEVITLRPVVDQQNNGTMDFSTDGNIPIWQSFTAGISGYLTGIDIQGDLSIGAGVGTLRVYQGGGPPTGSPLSTQYVGSIIYGWETITLANPVPVQAGNQYTYSISEHYRVFHGSPWGDTYPAGESNLGDGKDYAFRTWVSAPDSLVITQSGDVGIGTTDPGDDRLDVRGRAYAEGGWQTTNADYAEWFEKEEDAIPGDIIGINIESGKARIYRPGDRFIGVCSANPAYVGNRLDETDEQMAETHILVGLLGQVYFDEEQVITEGRIVKTTDGVEVGILLSNGKVFIGR